MKADVTGDGTEEIFLSSSLTAVKSEVEWTVFDVNDRGTLAPYSETIRAFLAGAWPSQDPAKPGLVKTGVGDREARRDTPEDLRRRPLTTYSFSFPTISETREELPDKDVYDLEEKNREFVPKVEAILLSDFLEGKDGWDTVEHWQMTLDDKLKRSDDWDQAMENKKFTAKVALASLDVTRDLERRAIESKPEQNKVLPGSERDTNKGGSDIQSGFLRQNWPAGAALAAVVAALIFYYRSSKKARS